MSKKPKVNVTFIGQDYSEIDKVTVKVTCDEEVKEKLKLILPVDKECCRIKECSNTKEKTVLEKFLRAKCENLSVLGSNGEKSGKKCKIWDPDFGKGYFCGAVGVVESDMYMDDLFQESEVSPDLKEFFGKRLEFHIRLQIQSRMDITSDETSTPGKPYFLSTMLLHDKLNLDDDTVPTSEDEIFDFLLLFWFREQFLEASRKGFYCTYRRFERNDDRLRGCIDIARHICLNMGQDNGKIAYSYRENTVNNYINHLIVAAYECLKKKYYDLVTENFDSNMELKREVDHLKREIGYSQYTSYELIAKNLKPIAHPFYTEYEELRKTCIKILRNEGISFFDADREDDTKSILFYLPDLWEDFLKKEICDGLKVKDPTIKLEPQEHIKVLGKPESGASREELFQEQNIDYVQDTIPDYVFFKKFNRSGEDTPFMILDAKFKPKWEKAAFPASSGNNISEVLPDYDKCIRDMISIHAHATGVIFPIPERKDEKDIESAVCRHRISCYNQTDCFYTIPVPIPFAPKKDQGMGKKEPYQSWKNKLKKEMAKTIPKLCEYIAEEAAFFEEYEGSKI